MKTLLKIFLILCVYAGCIFPASASVQLKDIDEIREYFKKGFLQIKPSSYKEILKYAGEHKPAFKSYDGMVSLKGWGEKDDVQGLLKLLHSFTNLTGVRCYKNTWSEDAAAKTLGKALQFYPNLTMLDLQETALNDKRVDKLLAGKGQNNPSSLKILNLQTSSLSPKMLSEIKANHPHAKVIVGTDAKDPLPHEQSPKQAYNPFSPTNAGIEVSRPKITGQLNYERYELLTDINRKFAQSIQKQTGVEILFEPGEQEKKDFVLSQGNFGKFMLARNIDVEPKRVVGVKQVKGEIAIKNSLKEGEIQAQFNHANVMPLLDYINYESNDNPYDLALLEPTLYQFMPLASFGDGAFFQQKLALMKNTPLQDKREKVFGYVAEGLLKGLAYMHSLNFYHLDFKNTNFVLMRDGTPMIIDFGCTQKCDDADKYDKGMGDTGYYSPQRLNFARFNNKIEHAEKAEFYSPSAADAWALGVTLIEMWENLYPFDKLNKDRIYQSWDKKYFATKLAMITSIQAPKEGSIMDMIKRMLALEDKDRLRVFEALQHPAFKNRTYDVGSEEDRIKLFKDIKALQQTKESTTGIMTPSDPQYTLNIHADSQKVGEVLNYSEPKTIKETPIATAAIKIEKINGQQTPSLKPLYRPTADAQKPIVTSGTSKTIEIEEEEKRALEMKLTIPPVAIGYEDIYQQFLKGTLIYRPNKDSDDGMIRLPIAQLANPLEGTFDLSQCGDAGKYLAIGAGYRKGKKTENKDKVEIWLAPRFLIEKELKTTASHFKDIMSQWSEQAPVGIFWTWGNWDNLTSYDYLTTETMAEVSNNHLYKKWSTANGNWPPPRAGRRGTQSCMIKLICSFLN